MVGGHTHRDPLRPSRLLVGRSVAAGLGGSSLPRWSSRLCNVQSMKPVRCFSLKGGTLLQHRLGLDARATSDIDSLVRGDLTRFLAVLDEVIKEPGVRWGLNEDQSSTSRHLRGSRSQCASA